MLYDHNAAMAELVDALDSGSSRGNSVDVRLILAAFPLSILLVPLMTLTVALVANGIVENPEILGGLIRKYQKVVAVDGGLSHCDRMGIQPDLIVGDLDSVDEKLFEQYKKVETLRYPRDKDETDTELAIQEVLKWHPEKITLFAGLGKRTDHALYNLQLLQRFATILQIETETERVFCLKKQDKIATLPGQTVSLIPLFCPVEGITSHGLKWELNNSAFDQHFMSLSNISMGDHFTISFEKGSLICCLQKLDS